MIIIPKPSEVADYQAFKKLLATLSQFTGVDAEVHTLHGVTKTITEIYLMGDTSQLLIEDVQAVPGVERVIRITEEYRLLARPQHHPNTQYGFSYQGLEFRQNTLTLFPGLCAVDNNENVAKVMQSLQSQHLTCTRMGAFKPRTSPYAFQGLGADCLPAVFELAGNYGIKVVAMEVTHERQIEQIIDCLENQGYPTGVMLQIGTRNAQNFELLRAVGSQTHFPVLLKRGFGISLKETLGAAEYVASSGNDKIILCLRGVKAHFAEPHRNFIDFSHVPVIHRLTKMPVCIDPSHAVGYRKSSPDGIMELFHATAQGIIAGANMVLADIHPQPHTAKVDPRQAIALDELAWYIQDINLCRQAYEQRLKLAKQRSEDEQHS